MWKIGRKWLYMFICRSEK
ncbi:hypothetical protein [Romboutsia lituseburensis]